MHVFAPVGGEHAAEAYDYLRRVWDACGDQFGMWHPMDTLGLPRQPPERHRPVAAQVEEPIAARRHAGPGVFQGLLRRVHDVLCLSVVLAPPPESMPSWVDLRHRWAQVSEPVPDGLLGVAEIYQARLADPAPARAEPTPILGAACRLLLPAPSAAEDFDGHGVAAADGFAVWEAERDDDARLRRRLVVVAPHDRDAELSAWTWIRGGDAAVTPFARYLMHAAKLRYHLRVWAGGEPLRGLRAATDRAAAAVVSLMDGRLGTNADTGHDAGSAGLPSADEAQHQIARLRVETYHLGAAITQVRQLRRTVEIAAANLAGYVPTPAPPEPSGEHAANTHLGLFADDRGLAGWFVQQLDDDLYYADETLNGGRQALDAAAALLTTPPGEQPDRAKAGHGHEPTRSIGGHDDSLRVLVLADEWLPGRGGITALNRYLCAALSAAGVTVYCVVPTSSPEEQADAARAGVRLLDAQAVPGAMGPDVLMRKPPLPADVVPDIVIGHGRITGAHAKAVTEDHFPKARRLHVVHTSPDESDWWRDEQDIDIGALAENRTTAQLLLSKDAAGVLAVGPRLHQWICRELSVFDHAPEPIRLDPGFDVADEPRRRPPPGTPQVLVLGRLDDTQVKGLDIAARAVGHADGLRGPADPPVELLLRGAPPGQARAIREQVLQWSGRPSLAVTVRNYLPDSERLGRDLRRASLLLMPSRAEGFGLVGVEAIVAGTPVLVSARSGLGELLREVLPGPDADQLVVPVRNDDDDAATWGRRIHEVLRNRDAAFARAESVRRTLRQRRTWAAAVTHLLTTLGLPEPGGATR
ncbi:CATRA conflict system CASPASE/TPR repeat-associated protein [Frankia sp. QA3]|uniref:CATRA conflict system CASPASE/TPR repeat-associated protein n=1 Tax=Frankia sp. QA3 TaxID=710111 RepID=UPI000269C643|nr:CATRA conflict system CASPASE/TPR repeat-associated protein [Frankia sp. QA3]EIV94947.1 glycosyltransferase [Frankia sp. QA3]